MSAAFGSAFSANRSKEVQIFARDRALSRAALSALRECPSTNSDGTGASHIAHRSTG